MKTFDILAYNLDSIRACFPFKHVIITDTSYDNEDRATITVRCKSFRTKNLVELKEILDDLGIGWFNSAEIRTADKDHINLSILCSLDFDMYHPFGLCTECVTNAKGEMIRDEIRPKLVSLDWKKSYTIESAVSGFTFADLYIAGNTFSARTLNKAFDIIRSHGVKATIPAVRLRRTENGTPISEVSIYID